MIEGFEVGASLTVATAKFDSNMLKSMDLVRKMTEGLERLRTVATGIFSDTGVTSLNRSLASTERRLAAATAETQNLTRAMDALAVSSAAVAGAVPRGGGGGARGGGGGGGFAAGWGIGKVVNNVGAGTALAVATGVYLDANIESYIARALVANQIDPGGDPMKSPQGKSLLDILQKETKRTGFSPADIGSASMKVMLGLTGRSFDEKLSVLPTILESAALESRIKGSSFDSNAEGMVSIAHMLQAYSPDQIAKILPVYNAMSMASPKSVPVFNRALSYGIGTGLSAGVDPDVLLAMNAAGQQLGLGTKSGTWADQFMRSLMPTVAGLTAHQQARHLAGMRVLGLVDAQGKSAAWDYTNDRLDDLKAFQILRADRDKMSRVDFSAAVQNAFGITGGRYSNQFSMGPALDNLLGLVEVTRKQLGADKSLEELNKNDPVQRFKSNLASTEVSLAKLGSTTLHILNPAFEKLAKAMEVMTSSETGTGIASTVLAGGGALWLAKKFGLGKPAGKLGGMAVEGLMETEAGASVAAIAATVVPIAVGILAAGAAGVLMGMAANYGISKAIQALTANKALSLGDWAYQTFHGETAAERNISAPSPPSGNVHIHGPVHVHMPPGTTQDHMRAFVDELSRASTRTTQGQGSFQSPTFTGTP